MKLSNPEVNKCNMLLPTHFSPLQDDFVIGTFKCAKIGLPKVYEMFWGRPTFSFHCQVATAVTMQVMCPLQEKSCLPSWLVVKQVMKRRYLDNSFHANNASWHRFQVTILTHLPMLAGSRACSHP